MSKIDIEKWNKQFHLSEKQIRKYIDWVESLPDAYFGAMSNGITISFSGCSVGQIVSAKRREGEEIDLTDWENF